MSNYGKNNFLKIVLDKKSDALTLPFLFFILYLGRLSRPWTLFHIKLTISERLGEKTLQRIFFLN